MQAKPPTTGSGQTSLADFFNQYARTKPPSHPGSSRDDSSVQSTRGPSGNLPLRGSPEKQSRTRPRSPKRPLGDSGSDEDTTSPTLLHKSPKYSTTSESRRPKSAVQSRMPPPHRSADQYGSPPRPQNLIDQLVASNTSQMGFDGQASESCPNSNSCPSHTKTEDVGYRSLSSSSEQSWTTARASIEPKSGAPARRQLTTSSGSFGSCPPSSQRVFKDGEIHVRNSDSEETDESLEDLEDILGPPKAPVKSASPVAELPRTQNLLPDRELRRSSRTDGRAFASARVKNQPVSRKLPKQKLKFDLDTLTTRVENESKINISASKALEDIQELDRARAAFGRTGHSKEDFEALVHQNTKEENATRVLDALDRTEALVQERSWPFIDYDRLAHYQTLQKRQHHLLEEPNSLPNHPIAQFLHPNSHQHFSSLIATGSLREIARKTPLPKELCFRLFNMACEDTRASVRSECLAIISEDQDFISQHFDFNVLFKRFERLGCNVYGLSSDSLPAGVFDPDTGLQDWNVYADWNAFGRLREVFAALTNKLPFSEVIGEIMCVVCRMAGDSLYMADLSNHEAAQFCMSRAIEVASQEVMRLRQYMQRIFFLRPASPATEPAISHASAYDEAWKLRVLRVFPNHGQTAVLACRQLAMSWFFDDAAYLARQPSPFGSTSGDCEDECLVSFDEIHSHLAAHPETFGISFATNFAKFKSYVCILAVGLGPGDRPNSGSKELEKKYDMEVDKLADVFKGMNSAIVDNGVSHPSRTEAKEILRKFIARLENIIRTTPPPRKDLFGEVEGNTAMMRSFAGLRKPPATSIK